MRTNSERSRARRLSQSGPTTSTPKAVLNKACPWFSDMLERAPRHIGRGKACKACRSRKLRCDGRRPFCTQCKKSKVEDDCEYKDGIHKSHTRILLEQIAQLETRLEALENPHDSDVQKHEYDCPVPASPSLSFSSASTDSIPPPSTPLPVYPEPDRCFNISDYLSFAPDGQSAGPCQEAPDILNAALGACLDSNHLTYSEFIPKLSINTQTVPYKELISIFIPHRFQVGLKIPELRLLAILKETSLPCAFRDVMCLWGCYFSPTPQHTILESQLLADARRSLNEALKFSKDTPNTIRALCMLSLYLSVKGYSLEGRYYANAAVSLAIGAQFHKIGSLHPYNMDRYASAGSSFFQPSMSGQSESLYITNPEEYEDKCQAFWQVFYLDRCLAIASGQPPYFSESGDKQTKIEVPWPAQNFSTTEQQSSSFSGTIESLFLDHDKTVAMSDLSLCVRAAVLLEKSMALSTHISADNNMGGPHWRAQFALLDDAIRRCKNSIQTPLLNKSLALSNDETEMEVLTARTLLLASLINMRLSVLHYDETALHQALNEVSEMVAIIHEIDDVHFHYQNLDPVFRICWLSALNLALQYQGSLLNPENSKPNASGLTWSVEMIEMIIEALKKLENVFPSIRMSL